MGLRGESVGEAYIRILADGSRLSDDIKSQTEDALKDANDPEQYRRIGAENAKAYEDEYEKVRKDGERSLNDDLDKIRAENAERDKGRANAIGDLLAGEFGKAYKSRISEALGGGGNGNDEIANRIFNDAATKAQGKRSLDSLEDIFTNISALRNKALADIKRDEDRESALTDAHNAEIRSKILAAVVQIRTIQTAGEQARLDDITRFHSESRDKLTAAIKVRRDLETAAEKATEDGLKAGTKVRQDALNDGVRDATKFEQKIKQIADKVNDEDYGKLFGAGSRNNFINAFGSIVGAIVSGTVRIGSTIANVIPKAVADFKALVDEAGSVPEALRKIGSAGLDSIGNGALKLLGAFGAVKLALVGIQLFLGPLAALIANLGGLVVALASSIGIGLLGALGAILPLLGVFGVGIAAVAVAFTGLTKAQKAALAVDFKPLVSQFKNLQKQVQQGFFGGDAVQKEVSALQPLLTKVGPLLVNSAKAISNSVLDFTRTLDGSAFSSFLDVFTKFAPQAITKLGIVFDNVFLGIGGLVKATIPVADRLLDSLTKGAEKFEEFTNSTDGQGKLTTFFDKAYTSAQKVYTTLKLLTEVLFEILKAGEGTGDTIFDKINTGLGTYLNYLKSASGQTALAQFFSNAERWAGSLAKLVGGFGQLFDALDNSQSQSNLNNFFDLIGGIFSLIAKQIPAASKLLSDFGTGVHAVIVVLGGLASFISSNEDIFKPLIIALGALAVAGKFSGQGAGGFIGSVAKFIGSGVVALVKSVGSDTDEVLSASNKLGAALGGLAIIAGGSVVGSSVGGAGGLAIGVGAGAVGGALIGSTIAPGLGTAIGAGVGAIVGGITTIWGESNKAAQQAASVQKAALLGIQQAAEAVTTAIEQSGDAYGDAAKKAVIAGLQKPAPGTNVSDTAAAHLAGINDQDIIKAVAGDQNALTKIQNAVQQFRQDRATQIAQLQAAIKNDQGQLRLDAGKQDTKGADAERAQLVADQKALDALTGSTKNYETALDDLLKKIGANNTAIKQTITADDEQAASIGKLNLAGRSAATQVIAYGKALSGTGLDAQRNTQYVKDNTDAINANVSKQLAAGDSVKSVAKALESQITSFTKNASAAGLNGTAVDALVAKYLKVPAKVLTQIIADGSQISPEVEKVLVEMGKIKPTAVISITAKDHATAVIQAAVRQLAILQANENIQFNLSANGNTAQGRLNNAHGSIVRTASKILAGEAGAEAIVPLNRPLSQVDPQVRALSAYAQGIPLNGEAGAKMARGGIVGGETRVTNIAPGAIVVNTPTTDGVAVASEVLARLTGGGYI